MKRFGYLYEKMLDPAFIDAAICEASRGKSNRPIVRRVLGNKAEYIEKIRRMLVAERYNPSPYHVFERYDACGKKYRKIQRPEFFPDQIIHWLAVMALEPVFKRGMYYWNCGSIPGRGIQHGSKAVKRWLRDDEKHTKYAAKLDLRKYYDSIPKDKLMELMRSKIKDAKMLALLQKIINTSEAGIPIGNYTSQWFANVYLESLDHYITEKLGVKHYVRYVDDMVLFGCNKKELHKARKKIAEFLKTELGLELKGNWQVYKTEPRGVDFLGYVFHRGYIKLRARNFLAFARQCRKVKKMTSEKTPIPFKTAAGLISRLGQLSHCNSYKIKDKHFKGINIRKLKKAVSDHSKRSQNASTRKLQPALV